MPLGLTWFSEDYGFRYVFFILNIKVINIKNKAYHFIFLYY